MFWRVQITSVPGPRGPMTDVLGHLSQSLAGRYAIERELGGGGIATVYLAHDVGHDRQVAIKVLREDVARSLGAERFLPEIRLAAKLSHPHIVHDLPHILARAETPRWHAWTLNDRRVPGDLDRARVPLVEPQAISERMGMHKHLEMTDALRTQIEAPA